jgi:hypothetical protein
MVSDNDGTVRITMRLPVETKDELYKMCAAAGLRPSNVFAVALMVGMRTLVQDLSLQETSEMWDAINAARSAVNRRPRIGSPSSDSDD